MFLALQFLSPWWWRRYVHQNHQFLQEPHGFTSQKTIFFIKLPAMKIHLVSLWAPHVLIIDVVKNQNEYFIMTIRDTFVLGFVKIRQVFQNVPLEVVIHLPLRSAAKGLSEFNWNASTENMYILQFNMLIRMPPSGMSPCGFCKNRRFGGTYRHQGERNQRATNSVSSM
jgi:hypothetical protein